MNKTKFVVSLAVSLYTAGAAHAQTFLDHLRQSGNGKGKVEVVQTKEIDELVNGNGTATPNGTAVGKPANGTTATAKTPQDVVKGKDAKVKEGVKDANGTGDSAREAEKAEEARKSAEARRRAETKSRETEKTDAGEGDMEIPTVDMRKKVMRGSRKVTGYRVQAFAGGNTRNDRQRAQEIGNAIKMKYPDLPIYVHFYSPRWICRVGNFRSYQEAQKVLGQVKAMGYKGATIVSGKITVQD